MLELTDRMRIVYADGPYAPRLSPDEVLAAAGLDPDAEAGVTLGWIVETQRWMERPTLPTSTTMAGYGLMRPVNDGAVRTLPLRLGAVATALVEHPPEVAVVTAVRRGAGLAFHRGIGWADVLARTAKRVVVELVDGDDIGTPTVGGNVVAVIERTDPFPAPPQRSPDQVDRAIAEHVVGLVPRDATLQLGIGAVPDAVAAALEQPVNLWSGLVTNEMAAMLDRGLLSTPAVAAYTWGDEPIEHLHRAGMLRLQSTTVTHDVGRLSRIPRFVAVNAAIQVGLDGSVNVEHASGRTITGIGGHSDFCLGGSLSSGGMSIIALRSRDRSGGSAIVPRLSTVTTQRSDINVVVTEYGVADLRERSDSERVELLTAISAPEHRDELHGSR